VVQFNVPEYDDKKEQHLVQQQHQLHQASSLAAAALSRRNEKVRNSSTAERTATNAN
jgi:hypothetical protein